MSIDIQNCLIGYYHHKERLEDPCSGSVYRVEDGFGYQGPIIFNKQPQRALPKLDIAIDDQGYLYVKKPRFDIMHDGVIWYGRFISYNDLLDTSKHLLDNFMRLLEAEHGFKPNIPLKLSDGKMLINIEVIEGYRYSYNIEYTDIHNHGYARMHITYCNCSYTLADLVLNNMYSLEFQDAEILRADDKYIYRNGIYYSYTDNGFEILAEESIVKDLLNMDKVSLYHDRDELLSIIKDSKEYELLSRYATPRINGINPSISKAVLSSTKVINDGKLILEVYVFVDPNDNIHTSASCTYEVDDRIFYEYAASNVLEFIKNPPCLKSV